MKKKLVLGLVVLVLGATGGWLARPSLARALGIGGEVDGRGGAERREGDRLVLTLRMGDDTMMATFRNRVDDIAELVEVGDVITLRARNHVFADDVPIVRVTRPPPEPPPAPPPTRGRRRHAAAAEAAAEHAEPAGEVAAAPPEGEASAPSHIPDPS